ncbi:MAG: asparagine synthase (glutamine-hydrolyzing) [Candidatus Thiodiazotropha taylori]
MCGFAGIVKFSGDNICSDEILKSMGHALRFRGPDEETLYRDGDLAFVFRRLSIVDIEGGTQPIWNEDRSIFVAVNGEIYNHLSLRKELSENRIFSTNSDSEIVLHLYEEFGLDAFAKLNGMFAIAIWDCNRKELILCRDRVGIKPLYIAETDEGVLFGSELKALLQHSECPNKLDWSALEKAGLKNENITPSYIEGVSHFPAGHYLILKQDNQELNFKRYWQLDDSLNHRLNMSESEIQQNYNSLIQDSINKRLMADVPVGVFFSGGLDSSLIAAVASRLSSSEIHCFTVVDKATYDSGDVQQAKNLAEQNGFKFYPILFNVDEMISEFSLSKLEQMIYLMESPRFDLEWFYKSELHKAAKKLVPSLKVILLGQGADEFSGGYSKYLGSSWHDWREYIDGNIKPSVKFRLNKEAGIPERFNAYFDYSQARIAVPENAYKQMMKAFVSQLQFFNLWHEDRTSSYYGIESRVPFLDHRILEFLAAIPAEYHESLFWNKSLVRKAVADEIENYPRDHPKVPFFVTDDQLAINALAKGICKNIYKEFCESYLTTNALPVSQEDFDELFTLSQSGNIRSADFAWQLIELMSVVIFERLCSNISYFVETCDNSVESAFSLFDCADWDKLPDILNSSVYLKDVNEWKLSAKINIPSGCEIVNLLTEEEDSTELIWLLEGTQVLRIKVPLSHDWLVQLFDEMGRYRDSPKDLKFWAEKTGIAAKDLVNNLGRFVKEGYISKL